MSSRGRARTALTRVQRDRRLAYPVALAVPAAITVLRLRLGAPESDWPATAAAYVAMVIVLAVTLGLPKALLALVESALLLDYFFVGPATDLSIPNTGDVDLFVTFVLLGLVAALAIAARRGRAQRLMVTLKLTQAQAELNQSRAAGDQTEPAGHAGPAVEEGGGTTPLKVVYFDHCAQLSGGEIALARLLEAMPGVDRHVILGEEGPLRQMLERRGVAVEVRPLHEDARATTRNRVNQGFHSLTLAALVMAHAWRLSRRLRELKPDLVHTNSLKAAVYGSLAAQLANVPVVCHLRDRLATDYMSRAGMHMMRLVLRWLPNAVIANSSETMGTLAPATAALPVFGAVTYDPVPARAATEQAKPHPLVVGMVGRLTPWKGQRLFIEAFARAFPAGKTTALIVGSAMFGEGDYEEELRRQVARLGLGARVTLVGFTDDVNGYLSRFDILVHASLVPEPFGQVVAEGMCAGLPVIAANAGGPSEVIENGVTGVLFPPGDVDALAVALLDLVHSPGKRLAMGTAARVKSAEFRPERIARQVMAVYRVVAPTAFVAPMQPGL